MPDYNWITPRLATGAALSSADDVWVMVRDGITHVIDCRLEFDDTALFVAQHAVAVLWNGTNDDGQMKQPDWFEKSIDFALSALSKPKVKVYAHCAAGVNRGPSTAYAIMRAIGWSAGEAEKEIRAARPQVGLAYKNDADSAVKYLGYE